MSIFTHDIDGLDDIWVLQGAPDAKFGGDLLLILLLRLSCSFWTEFLHGEDRATILAGGLNQTNCSACARSKDSTPFSVLFGEMSLCCVVQGENGSGGFMAMIMSIDKR